MCPNVPENGKNKSEICLPRISRGGFFIAIIIT